jgi:hypothetical protein
LPSTPAGLLGERAVQPLLVLGTAAALGEDVDDDGAGGALETESDVEGDDLVRVVLRDDLMRRPGARLTASNACSMASRPSAKWTPRVTLVTRCSLPHT